MEDETLQALDQSFDVIWQNTDKIPSALKYWQDQLAQLFAQDDLTQGQTEELQRLMDKWSRVLAENRKLLAFHLEHLQDKLEAEKNASTEIPYSNKKFTRQ